MIKVKIYLIKWIKTQIRVYQRKNKKRILKSRIIVIFSFSSVHLAKDCRLKIRLKSLEKPWKTHTFKKHYWKKRNLSQIKYFSRTPMTLECVSRCINLGRPSWFLDSKDSKAEIGITNTEDHYMFTPLRKNLLKKRLIELSNTILNSIKAQVKVSLHFRKDILRAVCSGELIWLM